MLKNQKTTHEKNIELVQTGQQVAKDFISVIVPVYNVSPYLREAIDSVINQTYKKLEIILVDDGAKDGSGDICDEYSAKDERIRVIHQKNMGLSAARNTGLDVCKGEYISFFDSDDVFCNDALEKMLGKMLTSGADIVECNLAIYNSVRPLKLELKERKAHFRNRSLEGIYTKHQALHMQLDEKIATCVWNKLYRRKVWDDNRFRVGQNFEDRDIILHVIASVDHVYIMDEVLILHRKWPGSITSTLTISNVRDRTSSLNHYRDFVETHIPDLFMQEHLTKVNQKVYSALLDEYFMVISDDDGSHSEENIRFLKMRIEESRTRVNLKDCDIETRIATFIYSHIPRFVGKLIFRGWRPMRFFFMKVLKK